MSECSLSINVCSSQGPSRQCAGYKVDVVFLLDGSKNMGKADFQVKSRHCQHLHDSHNKYMIHITLNLRLWNFNM